MKNHPLKGCHLLGCDSSCNYPYLHINNTCSFLFNFLCTIDPFLNKLYNLYTTGLPLTEHDLREVAEVSGVVDVPEDFLTPEFREECARIIPDMENHIKPSECKDVFLYLKDNFRL